MFPGIVAFDVSSSFHGIWHITNNTSQKLLVFLTLLFLYSNTCSHLVYSAPTYGKHVRKFPPAVPRCMRTQGSRHPHAFFSISVKISVRTHSYLSNMLNPRTFAKYAFSEYASENGVFKPFLQILTEISDCEWLFRTASVIMPPSASMLFALCSMEVWT